MGRSATAKKKVSVKHDLIYSLITTTLASCFDSVGSSSGLHYEPVNVGNKYMPVTKKSHAIYPHYLEVRPYKFQVVNSFTYLGSGANCNNDIVVETQKRILASNRCFYGLIKHLRSHLTSKNTKILIYKVLIRHVLAYASETWSLSKANERRLNLFE